MGRVSTKENKNIYQIKREELGLTREKASEIIGSVTPERIEKIENERSNPHPDEVRAMAEGGWFSDNIIHDNDGTKIRIHMKQGSVSDQYYAKTLSESTKFEVVHD